MEGLAFHQHYFTLPRPPPPLPGTPPPPAAVNTLADARVRLLPGGTAAVVAYTRLTQCVRAAAGGGGAGVPHTDACNETRVWERRGVFGWTLVHFHRSRAAQGWPGMA